MHKEHIKIDLHTHSHASDGLKSPSSLIDYSIENNIEVLSITDHDTVAGIAEASKHCADKNIKFIPGIEFSVKYPKGSYHLLGYNIDHTYAPLLKKIEYLSLMRDTRAQRIVSDLQSHGFDITIEEITAECSQGAIGRPHIARVLVKKGYTSNITEAFKDFLVAGKPGFIPKDKITIEDAIKLTYDAGGIPVISHAHSLKHIGFDEFELFLKESIDSGIKGIEAYSSVHTPQEAETYVKLAKKYNLLITGGSDYQGDKNEVIGYYQPEHQIPAVYLDSFLQAL